MTDSHGTYSLECDSVCVGYGGSPVLRDATIRVRQHSVAGVLGRNGAGKTTLLEALAGELRLSSGSIRVCGTDVSRLQSNRRARLGIALVPQGRRMLPGFSVRENLAVGGQRLRKRQARQQFDKVCELFPVVVQWLTRDAQSLSGGQQQIVAIARAVMSAPDLLLLDEPLTGLSPTMVDEVCETIDATRDAHAGVVVAEQNAAAVVDLVAELLVIDGGQAHIVPGSSGPEKLKYVQERYLSLKPSARPMSLPPSDARSVH